MTALYVNDFKLGLDTRRSVLSGQPGSCRVLDGCVISQGGQIEKAKAWVNIGTLPNWSKGLIGTNVGMNFDQQLYTFGIGPAPGSNTLLMNIMLPYVVCPVYLQQLAAPVAGAALNTVYSIKQYGTHFFVSSVYDPWDLGNWWNGNWLTTDLGWAAMVKDQKMYRVWTSVIYFSGIGDPSVTNPLNPAGTGPNIVNPGAGFIDVALLNEDASWLTGIAKYYNQVAVFSRRATLLFKMDPDPTLNVLQQALQVGALSNDSIKSYGSGDLLFLADSGVRSLRAINASMAAGVTDVGAPVDRLIQSALAFSPSAGFYACAVLEPSTGRYMLALGNTLYVLNYWPSSKITAWSTMTFPENIDAITSAGSSLFMRRGNNLYLYGGTNGATYDNTVAIVETPHMSADTPTTFKKAVSIGIESAGTWSVDVGINAENPALFEHVATLTGSSYGLERIPFVGYGTHIGFRLTCSDPTAATLGAISAHFEKTRET